MFMRPLTLLAAATLLAAQAPTALAATLYKCVDAAGKIAYINQPCDGARNTAKTIDVNSQPSSDGRTRRYDRYNRYSSNHGAMSDYERAEMEMMEERKRQEKRDAAAAAREKELEELNRRKIASALDARNAKLREEAEQRKQAELKEYERWQKVNGKVQK